MTRRQTQSRSRIFSRPGTPEVIRIALAASIFLLLAARPAPAATPPHVCAGDPPADVLAKWNEIAAKSEATDLYGFAKRSRLYRANRKAVEAGTMTAGQAKAAGGTAFTGVGEFPVFPFSYSNSGADPFTPGDLHDLLFDPAASTKLTMKEYYEEVSYGNYSVDGEVAAWTTLANDDQYYEGNSNGLQGDANIVLGFEEVLTAQDGTIDFSQYDNDGPDGVPNSGDDDGMVDFVMFVSPDIGGECGGDGIWSHRWSFSGWSFYYGLGSGSFQTNDASNAPGVTNIYISDYFVSGGRNCSGNMMDIGTTCHEFGHALDIKDLYDTNGGGDGIGEWGLMGAGNWNSQPSPAHMTAWTKERLGWLSYFIVTSNTEQLCMPPVETHPVAARLWTNGDVGPEYFVVENRQKIGFDEQLPSPGLVIYHIDEDTYDANASDNQVNANEAHKAIDVECADATTASHANNADDLDISGDGNRGDAGDVWCTSTKSEFTPSSIPDTRGYNGNATNVGVYNIGDCDGDPGQPVGWICADFVSGTPSTVDLCIHDCAGDGCSEITNCDQWWGSPSIWIDNDEDGDDDLPAEGIDNKLWFRVDNNKNTNVTDATVKLYWADPALGQLWPSTGNLIASVPINNLGPNDFIEDYVVFNYPTSSEWVGHYCIGAIAVHGSDVQNSEWAPNDNNVAQVNHQVLVARAGGGKTAACPGPILERSKVLLHPGPFTSNGTPVQVVLGTPPLYNDVLIPAGWRFDYDSSSIFVPPAGNVEYWVTMSADNAAHGDSAYVPITMLADNVPIGGAILEYVIDCYEPQVPGLFTIDCLDPSGDDLSGPSVLVEFAAVDFDINGSGEMIQYYEIWRGDNQGNPVALVEQVAIDEDPGTPGFQWYDVVPLDSGFVYTYQARAVDGGLNVSAFTAPINVECKTIATSIAEGLPAVPGQFTIAKPNPFNPTTTIAFTVPYSGLVDLKIYDTAGRLVRTLISDHRGAGLHEVQWNGRDQAGHPVSSGLYFYKYDAREVSETKKLMLTR